MAKIKEQGLSTHTVRVWRVGPVRLPKGDVLCFQRSQRLRYCNMCYEAIDRGDDYICNTVLSDRYNDRTAAGEGQYCLRCVTFTRNEACGCQRCVLHAGKRW